MKIMNCRESSFAEESAIEIRGLFLELVELSIYTFRRNFKLTRISHRGNFWRMIRAPRYFFQPSSTRLSKVYAPAIRLHRYRRIFPRYAPLFPFDTSTLPGEEKWGPDRRRQGGKYLQRDGAVESADMNLLHPDEAKSNRGFGRKGKGWRTMAGNTRGWVTRGRGDGGRRGRVRRLLYSRIIYHPL